MDSIDKQEQQAMYRSAKEVDKHIDDLAEWAREGEDKRLIHLLTILSIASDAVLQHLREEGK